MVITIILVMALLFFHAGIYWNDERNPICMIIMYFLFSIGNINE